MHKPSLFFAATLVAGLLVNAPGHAQETPATDGPTTEQAIKGTQADIASLAELRDQINTLNSLVLDLSVENKRLSGLIEQMMANNSTANEKTTPCSARMRTLQNRLDAIKALGYGSTHPDKMATQQQLETVQTECAAEQTATNTLDACINRITATKKKLDQLLVLGYTTKHPDVVNVTSLLKSLRSTCADLKQVETLESSGR
jgi:TolA-binding protein